MLQYVFQPRFQDTDALGHVNNASIVTWFEEGRRPFFEFFTPDLDPRKWCLILARIEVDFLAQGYYQRETTIRTSVERIGTSSFVLVQEALQGGAPISRGRASLVHYDYAAQKSSPIPADVRAALVAHLATPAG